MATRSRNAYRGRVGYAEHPPSAALRRHVACFWTLSGQAGAHRVLPDGCMDLLFDLGAPRDQGRVIGTMTHAIVADAPAANGLLGVRFRPGAAMAVGCLAREVRDGSFGLDDVWGPIAREIEARVAEAESTAEAVRVLERELLARLAKVPPPDARVAYVVASIEACGGLARVSALADEANVGERHLVRLFDDHVGVGPKTFARVVRVQRVVAAIATEFRARRPPSWAAIACDVGYADQAHMIRDVRSLAGVTPAVLAAERAMSDPFNPS